MNSRISGLTQADSGLRAIQTEYRGYKFRSRLEARWAVFFDALGVKWSYEVEGYELPSGWYLPDFHLTDYNIYVEVKPANFKIGLRDTIERTLCKELAEAANAFVWLAAGDPMQAIPKQLALFNPERAVDGYLDDYDTSSIDQMAAFTAVYKPRFRSAMLAARQARFEHGAQP